MGWGANFGHRPSCRHHCRPVEKAETTTCSSICERRPGVGGVGGGLLPYKRLMEMCHRMGSHFHDWIDYNGVAFSIESSGVAHFLWVRQFFIFTGSKRTRIFVLQMKSKVFFIQSKNGSIHK